MNITKCNKNLFLIFILAMKTTSYANVNRIPSYSHIANCSEATPKLQNSSTNSTFYRFTRLLNSKQVPNVLGEERRTSWDKR